MARFSGNSGARHASDPYSGRLQSAGRGPNITAGHDEVRSHLPPPASGVALGDWPHHLLGPPQLEMGLVRPAQRPGVGTAWRETLCSAAERRLQPRSRTLKSFPRGRGKAKD